MKKKKAAFTLIEMIIVIALTVVILGITSSMFITGNKVFSDSDVKSTLQMEAQNIQEKISDIGMQGIDIEVENISNVKINSYNKDGKERTYEIKIEGNELSITIYKKKIDTNGKYIKDESGKYEYIEDIPKNTLSTNATKFVVNPSYANSEAKSAQFEIELTKTEGSTEVTYPINFSVTFRNTR